MAQIGITKILAGARNVVFHIVIEGDGSGDVTDEVLIDPVDLGMTAFPSMTLNKLVYDLSAFTAKLEFDYLASDTPIWTLANQFEADFRDIGGLKDRSPVQDGTGKLMLTTNGLGSGDLGSILIWVRKD